METRNTNQVFPRWIEPQLTSQSFLRLSSLIGLVVTAVFDDIYLLAVKAIDFAKGFSTELANRANRICVMRQEEPIQNPALKRNDVRIMSAVLSQNELKPRPE